MPQPETTDSAYGAKVGRGKRATMADHDTSTRTISRPHCAYCNKPAAKMTTTVYTRRPGEDRQKDGHWYRYIYPATPLRSIEQCRAYTNQHVVSIAYSYDKTVAHFAEWDGETYWLKYGGQFCTTQCAVNFAKAAHKAGYRTPA